MAEAGLNLWEPLEGASGRWQLQLPGEESWVISFNERADETALVLVGAKAMKDGTRDNVYLILCGDWRAEVVQALTTDGFGAVLALFKREAPENASGWSDDLD